MNTCLQFLQNVMDTMYDISQFEIISGISIWTILFFTMISATFFTAFTRR